MVLTITDLRERILPDKVNFFGVGAGLLFSVFTQSIDGTALWIANRWFEFPPPVPVLSFVDSVLGAIVGSGLLWLVAEGYFRLRGREGMGLGDVKMMAAVGAFLGLQRTLMTILAGSLLGSVIGSPFDRNFEKRTRLRIALWYISGSRSLAGTFFRHSRAPLVSSRFWR